MKDMRHFYNLLSPEESQNKYRQVLYHRVLQIQCSLSSSWLGSDTFSPSCSGQHWSHAYCLTPGARRSAPG